MLNPRIPINDRRKILAWYVATKCKSMRAVYRWANSDDGQQELSRKVSWCGVRGLCLKLKKLDGDLGAAANDLPRCQASRQGKYSPVSNHARQLIVKRARNLNVPSHQRTATALSQQTVHGRRVSKTAIRHVLREAGLKYTRPQFKPALKPHHVRMRRYWADQHLSKTVEEWKEWVFSDEKTFRTNVQFHRQNRGSWIKASHPSQKELASLECPTSKQFKKINAWGAITWEGKLELCVFTGNMDAGFYKNTILDEHLFPYLDAHDEVKYFQQDNDSKHSSALARDSLNDLLGEERWTHPPPRPCKKHNTKGQIIRVVTTPGGRRHAIDCEYCRCPAPAQLFWPANSPDMNPMENVWSWMVQYMCKLPPTENEEDLTTMVFSAWNSVPLDYAHKLIASMPARVEKLKKAGGGHTHY